ncbi:flagellar hook-length control protein FliK [Dongia sp. agr-C8]
MQQIRFDFLTGVNGGNNRSSTANTHAAEQSGDAFARILDQQIARRGEDAVKTRAAEPRSNRNDASDRADTPRPQALKRRDTKSTAPIAQDKPAPKAKQPEKPVGENASCAKPATKPETDETDQTAEAAAGTQTTTENTASAGTTESDGQPDASGDQGQQQANDGTQQQGDGTDPSETVVAGTDPGLLALLAVPLPIQALSADTDVAVDATALAGGGNAATALQAGLAAQLANAVDFSAAVGGKAQGQAATAGLKFGAILNAGGPEAQQAAADAVTALQDAAQELAKAADPLASLKPAVGDEKPAAGSKKAEASQDKTAATVTPELNAKTAAAIVQPMARPAGVTWSGTTSIRNELAESMAVQAGAGFGADEAELSNWSQYLGSGATGLSNNIAAKQSAFMAQLRQNLQILPPHEQIAVQIRDAMQNGNSRLTVALHPVELGRVEVKLDIDKDKNVTATIVVDRPGTLDLLRNDAKALERALQDAGLQTDSGSLSFNLRDSNGQNGGSQNGTGTGSGSGLGKGASGSEVKAEVRADVVATADGYVDLET